MRDNNQYPTNRNIDQPALKAHHPKPSINCVKTLNGEIAEYFGVTLFCWTVQEDSPNISMNWVGQEFSSSSKTILGEKLTCIVCLSAFMGRTQNKHATENIDELKLQLCEQVFVKD